MVARRQPRPVKGIATAHLFREIDAVDKALRDTKFVAFDSELEILYGAPRQTNSRRNLVQL
jgi:hypothetical protein